MKKVAVAQVGTYLFNNERTIAQLRQYAVDAAEQKCEIVVFPEGYVGGYPKYMNFGTVVGTRTDRGRELFAEYANHAIRLEEADNIISDIARDAKITIITGIIERSDATLYCSVVGYDNEGYRIGHRRKLMPTAQERVIWGKGQSVGSPFQTNVGRVSTLICWENYMPLARMAMYQQNVDIYAAPTVDDRDNWQYTMRHIAREGRCFVLNACQYMTLEHFPKGWEDVADVPQDNDILIRGGSCIISPMGDYITQPVFNQPTLITAELDFNQRLHAGFDLDVKGHYHRPDIFNFSWE